MSAFQEHFLDKYFGYRRRYVEAVAALAPERRSLAVASEVARLGFSIAGSSLCAAILWLLVAGAIGRAGGSPAVAVLFAILAAVPTAFALLALRALVRALGDRKPA